jgi:hypothetical protein
MLLTGQGNRVVSCKNGLPPHGFDLCDQILDLSCDGATAADCGNQVPGIGKCERAAADLKRLEGEIAAQKGELATQMANSGPGYLVEPEE